MRKIIIVLMAVVLMSSSIMIPVGAAMPENTVQPLWDNTNIIDCTVLFIDGVGYAECVAHAKYGSTSIKTDIYVYSLGDEVWIYVAELHNIKNAISSVSSCTFEAELNETYRVDYTFTVTRNGIDEVITRTVYDTYSE